MPDYHAKGKIQKLTFSVPQMDGSKITVVEQDPNYGTKFHNFETIEEAETKATEIAHQRQADVYILKPVKKVSPKREVTVTDLP